MSRLLNAVSRRSFFWKLGAGASTALATTAGLARAERSVADDPALRAALLEEEKVLRKLHQDFQLAMDGGHHEQALALFTADARVLFNEHLFDERRQEVTRLLRNAFRAGKSGSTMQAPPGFGVPLEQQQDSVQIAPDRLSATAAFPYSLRVGVPIESENSLASMARLHGEGIHAWWEGGVYNLSYARDAVDAPWRISRLEYNTLARADYRPGRSHATVMDASPLSARLLEDLLDPANLA